MRTITLGTGDGFSRWWCLALILCCSFHLQSVLVLGQTPSPAARNTTATNTTAAKSPLEEAEDKCVGVFLTYEVTEPPKKIRPYNTDATKQPYSFESVVTLINYGYEEVPNWEVAIDFQHSEVIAEANGVQFLTTLPDPPGLEVGNNTRIVGVDKPSLMTSIDTAENEDLISANFTLLGTEFGVGVTQRPLPSNISLANDGYKCAAPAKNVNATAAGPSSQMWVCCTENITAINSSNTQTANYFPRQKGDITMTYDIMGAYVGSYQAQVSISMDNPMGRIDHWNLSWEWTQGEFIDTMWGAQILGPNEQDKCVYGAAATQYANDASVSFQNVMSCSPNPVVIDLTPYQITNETSVPFCCRNGSILPELIDPTQSKSNFRLLVKKLRPHMDQDDLSPPLNWNIAEGYNCTQPRQVSPTEFDPEALHSASAVASWQVVCNKTVQQYKSCCVSFSAYYNDSLIPCPTASCGVANNKFPWNGESCNPNIDAMLLPYSAVLLPPSNRTTMARQLATMDHYRIPTPLPCPDNCGVSLNWHVYSNYRNGWSGRLTVFNWDSEPISNWSAAVQLNKAMPGFQDVYSFNGSKVPDLNNTLFMQGQDGYNNNFLLGRDALDNPGKLQSILSFDKRKTLGIDVVNGDGFPDRVWFNGEECTIPQMFPKSAGLRLGPSLQLALVLIVTIFLLGGEMPRFL